MKNILLPRMQPEVVSKEIGDFVNDIVVERKATGAVIGLSGGVDSTTTAALIKKGFDEYNTANGTNLELVGYILPSKTNNPKDAKDGIKVATRLGIRYDVVSIEHALEGFSTTNPEAFESKYDKGNLTSRIRGIVLNTKAATERKVLAGTGNRDEDYGIGYYTLFGDGAVHMSPIGGLSKRLVVQMAEYLGFSDLAHREPTAGLEPGQTDFKDLGYKYNIVELVTEGLDQKLTPAEIAVHPQVAVHITQQLKQYEELYGTPKFTDATEVVSDIMARKETAALKSSLIHPPVPRVTLHYR